MRVREERVGTVRDTPNLNGKEGVSGSSPEEGFHNNPA
jgi:hypothetical protein